MEIDKKTWGEVDGKEVFLFSITNSKGNTIEVTNYGARWVSAIVADKSGKKRDVVIGFDNLEGYLKDGAYVGATVGRYANRIEGGKLTIDGKQYKLNANEGENILHGGVDNFSNRVWGYEVLKNGVALTLNSPDGDEGFPGNLAVRMEYLWSDDDKLAIAYHAQSDKDTHVSLTNHAYFNLKGDDSLVNNHRLKIDADAYRPLKAGAITSGDGVAVRGTPFDFTEFKPIGQDIEATDPQIGMGAGYDHAYVLKYKPGTLKLAVEVEETESGLRMELHTTYPSVHLYSANFLSSDVAGKNGKNYDRREAFCLEAQYFPNSPNEPKSPSTLLKKGAKYNERIEFHFSLTR